MVVNAKSRLCVTYSWDRGLTVNTKEIHVTPQNFHLGPRLAKVRSVRIENGETHTYNIFSLLFMVTNIYVMKKYFTHLLVVG